jgi:putative SOS response-associated peptidase YedK
MCGRYSIVVDERTLADHFGARIVFGHFEPHYNAAASQQLPIITTFDAEKIVLAKWGFVPEDFKPTGIRPLLNARSETAAEKRFFRGAFSSRRCLVLADGFFEWKTAGKRKLPYRLTSNRVSHLRWPASAPATRKAVSISQSSR